MHSRRMFNMIIMLHWITGFSIGFEYVPDYDDESHFAIDLGILRIIFSKPHEDDVDFE